MIPLLMLMTGAVWAAEESVGLKDRAEYSRHDLRVTSLCVEGLVIVVAHSDVGKGGGLQMMQLMREVNGKTVPVTCGAASEAEAVAPAEDVKKAKEQKKEG
jgi:hypothetical protein